jgi:hypothetical protein
VVTVKGSGLAKVFTLACTGANDGEEGPVTSFRLESVALGTDADGKPTTAPVVVQADVVVCDGSNLRGNAAKAMDALERAIEEHGVCPPDGSVGFPDGVATVTRAQWRDQFYADAKAKEPNAEENTLRQRLLRARTELIDAEKVGATGEWCYISEMQRYILQCSTDHSTATSATLSIECSRCSGGWV